MSKTILIQIKRVQIIRYILPIILFAVVLFYETWEHIIEKGEFYWNIHLTSEVFFFGILGPTAVFIALSYISQLLETQVEVSNKLEVLNQDLEQKVEERTELLKDRNNELAIANNELQKLDQLKTDFVSLVSHELRGPLTTLNGGIEMVLKEKDFIPAEAKRIFEIMADEGKRLTSFVQTILDVSKLEAGKLNMNLGLVAVEPLIRRVIDVTLLGSNREVVISEPNGVPSVWADEIYLEKILCNLVSNAEKYSPKSKPIEINIEKKDDSLGISVVDYGSGIPLENQGMVFDRFMRLHTGERLSAKGWGLGLYFSKALAEAQGGSISLKSPIVENLDPPGTIFTITLPLESEDINSVQNIAD